jgi:glucosamine--fructose-6-phosphate aminotransferase (isomerizing)
MCGIIGVTRRPSDRLAPSSAEILALVERAPGLLADRSVSDLASRIVIAADHIATADTLLRGVPGVETLLADRSLAPALDALLSDVASMVTTIEADLDHGAALRSPDLEAVNAALVRLKDASWAVLRDRLRTASAVADLAGPDPTRSAIAGYTSIQVALSAIDRLEVRGRDSAGVHVLVRDHELDLDSAAVSAQLAARSGDPLFASTSVRVAGKALSFVYKAAAEIGELGDNTNALRADIRRDTLLQQALSGEHAQALVLGHTRWASVGIISQPNAHPLNAEELGRVDGPYVAAALNGDVDNFADLKTAESLQIAPEITTDAKVIPTLVSRRLETGMSLEEAFRRTVATLEGSVAIAACAADEPGDLLIAQRGSGQALYVGLADDLTVVASEPYGLVEECNRYLRLDGETPADERDPVGTRGQVVRLFGDRAGSIEGIGRWSYDGRELPVAASELHQAEITTRDIDRGDHPHFLLKEITEAPSSFRKTLRGKLVDHAGTLSVALGPETLPTELRDGLADGSIDRVIAIGQGTAAVAAQALARALEEATAGTDLRVEAELATELSGFGLRTDMSDTLVVAVSQSGTTTDTNRTVDLARARGARVVAIVNRRSSDLTDKSDGVLYTSDGRDVEMSVASTKAFYSQVAAGFLLAYAIADIVAPEPARVAERGRILIALRDLPDAMEATLATRPAIAAAAQQLAPSKRYWAVVGSGADRIAAMELRIKLSELCYKAIACDATEDKKHIDLSSEPLILVCATGLEGSNADDVAKEVAIYRAHKATPIVIATEGNQRFGAALQALTVPAAPPQLAYVLCAVVGHLFGYEAALAIDAQAVPLRLARAAIEHRVSTRDVAVDGERLLSSLRRDFEPVTASFFDGLRSGAYNGNLEPATAVKLSSLLRYAVGMVPLDAYAIEYGRIGTPHVLVEDLTVALTSAIEELTRPIDAIKHQAKTVTVGISRADEGLLQVGLVREALDAGAARDRLSYRSLRALAGLDAAVADVVGYTRYVVEGDVATHEATITAVDRGGLARDLPLRTEKNPILRGTKHRVATELEVTAAVGRSDGRSLVIVPESKGNQCTGITLLHVRFHDRLPATTARSVLEQYRGRYAALQDAVTETEPTFRDDLLSEVPLVDLLTAPVYVLAERWRSPESEIGAVDRA